MSNPQLPDDNLLLSDPKLTVAFTQTELAYLATRESFQMAAQSYRAGTLNVEALCRLGGQLLATRDESLSTLRSLRRPPPAD